MIMLVEDDLLDRKSVKRAFKELQITNPLVMSENGQEAWDYLLEEASEKPSLILLDLNMPCMNGIEFLKIIKSHEQLRTIPVVVLTTSEEKRDRQASYHFGSAGYMVKPVDYQDFVEVIKTVHQYWERSRTFSLNS